MFFKNPIVQHVLKIVVLLTVFLLAGLVVCELMFADESSDPPSRITVATWNLEWFYDDFRGDNRTDLSKQQSSPSRNEWEWKKKAVANVIATIKPTILCLQEVENRDVVYQLRKQLEQDHDLRYRYAFISGYDFGTEQDVAIMYRSGLVEYSRREQTQEMFDSNQYYNLSKHLFARFEWGTGKDRETVTVFTGHLRARPEKRDLRQRQSRLVHKWLEEEIIAGRNVIVTGDFNTEDDFGAETADGPVAILRGKVTQTPQDDMLDVNEFLPADQRATHISGRQYDRIFYSPSLAEDDPNRKDLVLRRVIVRRDLVVQGEVDRNHWDNLYKIPQSERDISDHYPLVAEFEFR